MALQRGILYQIAACAVVGATTGAIAQILFADRAAQDGAENFESFNISSLLGRDGWFPILAGAFIEDHSGVSSRFGQRTLVLPRAGFNVPHGAALVLDEPKQRRFEADVHLTGEFRSTSDVVVLQTVDGDNQIVNVRVAFAQSPEGYGARGDVFVQQVSQDGEPEYLNTGAHWRMGKTMRFTIDVLARNRVHVLLDDELIFAGHDIASEFGGFFNGANRFMFIIQAGLAEVLIDNVAYRELVASDLNLDSIVDSADLAVLLGAWGLFEPIADLDGDGIVGGTDLAAMLSDWNLAD